MKNLLKAKFNKSKLRQKKPRKKVVIDIRKTSVTFVVVFVLLYLTQAFMHYQQSNINSDSKSEASTEYEEENDMLIIETNDSVSNYYNDKIWTLSAGLDGISGTSTVATAHGESTDKTSDTTKNITVQYTLDVKKDINGNSDIKLFTDDTSGGVVLTNIHAVGKNIYALLSMQGNSNSDNNFKSYLWSKYNVDDTIYNIGDLTIAYDFLNTIRETNVENYDVVFNCRTKLNGTEVDDITVYFNEESYGLRAFVDTKTHRIIKVVSSMISDNDCTDISYGKVTINNFTVDETSEAKAYIDNKLTKLSDGNIGCKLDDSNMGVALTIMCQASSYNNITLIDVNDYSIESPSSSDTITESEVENSGK